MNITVDAVDDVRVDIYQRQQDSLNEQKKAIHSQKGLPAHEKLRLLLSVNNLLTIYQREKDRRFLNLDRAEEIIDAIKRSQVAGEMNTLSNAVVKVVVLCRNIKPLKTSSMTKTFNDYFAIWMGFRFLADNGFELNSAVIKKYPDNNWIHSFMKRLRFGNPSDREIAAFYRTFAKKK